MAVPLRIGRRGSKFDRYREAGPRLPPSTTIGRRGRFARLYVVKNRNP